MRSNEVRVQAESHQSPDHLLLRGNIDPQTRPPAADRFPLLVTSVPVISTSGLLAVEDEDEWSCKVDELDKLLSAVATTHRRWVDGASERKFRLPEFVPLQLRSESPERDITVALGFK